MFDELQLELKNEKCAILQSVSGELERVVAVTALRLAHPLDNRVLMQIGTFTEEKGIVPKCVMPGGKRSRGELPQRAIQRVLETALLIFFDGIVLETAVDEVEIKESESISMRTKYLRTVHHAILKPEFPLDELDLNTLRRSASHSLRNSRGSMSPWSMDPNCIEEQELY